MSATIKKKFGVQAKLVESSGGVFEVYQNDKLIFSKKKTGKFPKDKEVLQALAAGTTDKPKSADKPKNVGADKPDRGTADKDKSEKK